MTVIVADLGGTNARFAYIKRGRLSEIYQFACDDFKNPLMLIQSFMQLCAPDAKSILIGIPGVVINGIGKWTNRSWCLSEKQLKEKLLFKNVVLMNDLEVQGVALNHLKKDDVVFFRQRQLRDGPKILVNIGTGLGSCFIVQDIVYPMEYGQTLLENGHCLETKVSGPAFKKIYQNLTKEESISAVKVADLYFKRNSDAVVAYQVFYDSFLNALKNLALTFKATGGIYFCGGVLDERILKDYHFARKFSVHPTMEKLLQQIPLIFIKKRDFAFLGFKMLVKKFGWS